MPGDPLRAEFIAKTYLENVTRVNGVRNMFGLQAIIKAKGFGNGIRNGNASIGIYSYDY